MEDKNNDVFATKSYVEDRCQYYLDFAHKRVDLELKGFERDIRQKLAALCYVSLGVSLATVLGMLLWRR